MVLVLKCRFQLDEKWLNSMMRMRHDMEPELAKKIKNAIEGTEGMQSYEQPMAQGFVVVDGYKVFHQNFAMYLVKFADKKCATDFVDSIAKILPSSTGIEIWTRDDGTALVSFGS